MRNLISIGFVFIASLTVFGTINAEPKDSAQKNSALDIQSGRDRLIVSNDITVESGKNYDTVVVVAGHLRFAAAADTLVVVSGKASLQKGSQIRERAVVIAGSIDQEDGALIPEAGIQSITSPTFETSDWGKDLKEKFFLPFTDKWDSSRVASFFSPFAFIFKVALFSIALVILLVLLLVAPKITEGPEMILREQPWRSFLVGCIAFLGFIPACIVLAITIVGILIVPFLAFAYLLASLAGMLAIMGSIGSTILGAGASRLWANLLGFLALMAVTVIPGIGGLVLFALASAGTGATVLAWFQRRRPIVMGRDFVSYQI